MQLDILTVAALISAGLSGVNLAFILKIIYNDLRHLDQKIDDHIRSHAERAERLLDKIEQVG